MAVFPALPLVSPEEYLNSSYRPDLEYVDGALVERSMPTILHSILQRILIVHFWQHRKDLGFQPLPEVRTQVVAGARYRIPDVMLCPSPLPAGRVINTVPWVVIEILSPDDRIQEQLERFQDYARIGVGLVVLMDPERLIAYRFNDGSLIQTQFMEVGLPSGSIPFDTDSLFRKLTEERNEGLILQDFQDDRCGEDAVLK